MKRVAIYARYSTDLQNCTSVEDQISACKRSLREDEIVEREFRDEAMSGAFFFTRPGVKELEKGMLERQFDVVICETLDRLSRKHADVLRILDIADFANITVRTVVENEIDMLHGSIYGLMGQFEREKIIERTRRGMRGSVERGGFVGNPPYGYEVDPVNEKGQIELGRRRLNEEKAKVVLRIFTEYANGKTVNAIVQGLNRDEVPGPTGGKWHWNTILTRDNVNGGILRNPFYIGKTVWGKTIGKTNPKTGKKVYEPVDPSEHVIVDNPSFAIIPIPLWNMVQSRLKDSHKPMVVVRGRTVRSDIHLICQHCDDKLVGVDYRYFLCAGKKRRGRCHRARKIDKRILYQGIYERLLRFVACTTDENWIAEFEWNEEIAEIERMDTRKRLEKVSSALEKMQNFIETSDIVGDQCRDRVMHLEMLHKKYMGKLDSLHDTRSVSIPNRQEILTRLNSMKENPGLRQPFLDELVDEVRLGGGSGNRFTIRSFTFRR